MISLEINGKKKKVDVPEDTPLLWVIREELNLLGTKFGCGKGLCGACTVHLNGKAIRSCVTPVAAAKEQNLTTIEGQLKDPKFKALKKMWHENSVAQCGYCQPGQLMSAMALLNENASPNSGEIFSAMAGNLCRCGTYPRIKETLLAFGGGVETEEPDQDIQESTTEELEKAEENAKVEKEQVDNSDESSSDAKNKSSDEETSPPAEQEQPAKEQASEKTSEADKAEQASEAESKPDVKEENPKESTTAETENAATKQKVEAKESTSKEGDAAKKDATTKEESTAKEKPAQKDKKPNKKAESQNSTKEKPKDNKASTKKSKASDKPKSNAKPKDKPKAKEGA